MNVLLLSPYPERILPVFDAWGDSVTTAKTRDIPLEPEPEIVVSFGYRNILPSAFVERFRCINLHISLLPWNRGSDPNFWSWYDNTLKGVTIHEIDSGIDTGPTLAHRLIIFDGAGTRTLATTYDSLQQAILRLFADRWKEIRDGALTIEQQPAGIGSYHSRADLAKIWTNFPQGWDTPVSVVEEAGRRAREAGG